jgi:hypothetical protein
VKGPGQQGCRKFPLHLAGATVNRGRVGIRHPRRWPQV